jgi:competence protein ComEC
VRILFLRWRHQLLERYQLLGAQNDSYAVLAAMTLGDKSALNGALRDIYSVTGASHILALSGLHLSIFYFLLSLIIPHRRRLRIISQVLLIMVIWAFVMLVGLPVSVVRSATMLTVFSIFAIGFIINV